MVPPSGGRWSLHQEEGGPSIRRRVGPPSEELSQLSVPQVPAAASFRSVQAEPPSISSDDPSNIPT